MPNIKQEILDVVDENDNVKHPEAREKIHSTNLWHRGVHVLLFNAKGDIFLQVRSAIKDKFPNCYDCSVSEHVRSGDGYFETAVRGIKEELGMDISNLKKIMKMRMNYGDNDNMISEIYVGTIDNNIITISEEIKKIEILSIDKLKKLLETNKEKFALWTYEIMKWYTGANSKIIIL